MIIPQNIRKLINKSLVDNFFKADGFTEIVEFCKQENNFEYAETIKTEIKYNEYIECAFNKLFHSIEKYNFTPFMLCYENHSYEEENEEISFSMILGIKTKNNKKIDVRIIYDYENELMLFEETEF